ncbi:hypothetical protein INT08_01730 [Prosthecochloris sp. N3]|uniref:UDP-N-acetyl glucosamine 2-epimerase n=1 Tax=Prosthecochloris ethylica TaxID=2743976 RepID=A0ABR9XQ35_9CHLB|nr:MULTISPECIES: hypothetical protein [Prosthecochloris]MEC9486340.1 hypothetical protein [Prosthecochloris sp.]MBF0586199.1 hypothetical protein [Prosthecochloris ethylica]MBF0635905.1 hypothetical protein [Prosthecochloris ethylica]NUK47420.1 hypothetical protein [Prosthecochloris ethylica]RNA64970.1 hypothetical protein CR163_006850 [Prosthecochloris sp. ZM_2]
MSKKILFIGGSINQTTQMLQIAGELQEYECFFSPFYDDGLLGKAARRGLLEFSIMGNERARQACRLFDENGVRVDRGGTRHAYDLVVTGTDLVVPRNIRNRNIVLVQEGMTEPETFFYHLARRFRRVPRWIAGTATTGLSHAYRKFCVASYGYRDLFIRKGVDERKIEVTSIPNFDDCARFFDNSFPYRDYVLVCTSDNRETFIYENRIHNIRTYLDMAGGRRLLFKLHPNEDAARALREIRTHAPGSLVFGGGNTGEMIANSAMMIAQYSSTILVGSALGKKVHSSIDPELLEALTPLQNRRAAHHIARVCREVIDG